MSVGGKRVGAGRKPRRGVRLVPFTIFVMPSTKEKIIQCAFALGKKPGEFVEMIVVSR